MHSKRYPTPKLGRMRMRTGDAPSGSRTAMKTRRSTIMILYAWATNSLQFYAQSLLGDSSQAFYH